MKYGTLSEVYAAIPEVSCKGCGGCCGPIMWSKVEDANIRAYCKQHGVAYQPPMPLKQVVAHLDELEKITCRFLDANKRCTIYEARPLVCRLFGHIDSLVCPNGKPERKLTKAHVDDLWNALQEMSR